MGKSRLFVLYLNDDPDHSKILTGFKLDTSDFFVRKIQGVVFVRAERGDQNSGRIFVIYFPIFSGNSSYSFSMFQNLGKITDI